MFVTTYAETRSCSAGLTPLDDDVTGAQCAIDTMFEAASHSRCVWDLSAAARETGEHQMRADIGSEGSSSDLHTSESRRDRFFRQSTRRTRYPPRPRSVLPYVAMTVLSLFAEDAAASIADARPQQRLSQYSHTAWRAQDGQFNRPMAIAQSPDGYLWIGTKSGLVRFDGVQFVPKNDYPGVSIAETGVDSVAASADGSIWIGESGKVFRIKDGLVTRYPINGLVKNLRPAENGVVWSFDTRHHGDDGPITKIEDGVVTTFPRPGGVLNEVLAAQKHGSDQFWIGGSRALCDWSPSRPARCFLRDKLKPFNGLMGISAIHLGNDGTLWVGIARAGPGLGLGKFVDERWVPFEIPGLRGDSLEVSSILEDRAGSMWIGTLNKGIFRIRDGMAEQFGKEDGLSGDEVQVNGIFEDRDRSIWVLTTSGLDQFHEQPVSVFSTREGLPANSVESVLPTRAGPVWIGNTTLSVIDKGISAAPQRPEFYAGKAVTSMLEDRAGRVWIGLDRTLNVVADGTIAEIKGRDGGEIGVVENIVEGLDNDIWVVLAQNPSKLLRINAMKVVEETEVATGRRVRSMVPNPKGGVLLGMSDGSIDALDSQGLRLVDSDPDRGWIGAISWGHDGQLVVASKTGLYVQLDETNAGLHRVPGLPCGGLISAVWGLDSRLWLTATCGLIKIEGSDLSRWMDHPDQDIETTLFDVTQGAEPGAPSFVPRSAVAADGTVWFATNSVALSIDPSRIEREMSVPDVMVQEITADKVTENAVDGIKLPPGTRDVDIRYTAIAFVAPQKTKFKYRLEGRDKEWQEAGARRQAFFTDLAPGQYTFMAKASGSAGTWGEQAASFRFEVLPAFHQTRWFAVLCGWAFIGLLYLAYMVRVRQVARELKRRLKVKSDERERIARDLHDTLLQDTQALVFSFQTLADEFPSGTPIRERMEQALDRADRVLAEGRDCVLDLRANDALPCELPEALSRVGDELANRGSQMFRSIVEGTPQSLKPLVRDEVYRIAREAMVNAFRHGQARTIELQLIFAPELFTIQVRDDGKGIDQQTLEAGGRDGHWGLRGMRERAEQIGGRLQIWSGTKPGTEVQLEIPAKAAYMSRRVATKWHWFTGLGDGGR